MGLLDNLSGLLGGQGASSDIVNALMPAGGNVGDMLSSLCANGLAEHVASWTGSGQNLPISTDQLRDALGNEQVEQMANSAGLPIGDFLKHLAERLPAAAAAAS